MVTQIAQINSKDPVLNRIQAELQKLNVPIGSEIIYGNRVIATLKAAGPTNVNHGLARRPLGFFIVDSTADVRCWRVGPATNLVLPVQSSADADVTLWVF